MKNWELVSLQIKVCRPLNTGFFSLFFFLSENVIMDCGILFCDIIFHLVIIILNKKVKRVEIQKLQRPFVGSPLHTSHITCFGYCEHEFSNQSNTQQYYEPTRFPKSMSQSNVLLVVRYPHILDK